MAHRLTRNSFYSTQHVHPQDRHRVRDTFLASTYRLYHNMCGHRRHGCRSTTEPHTCPLDPYSQLHTLGNRHPSRTLYLGSLLSPLDTQQHPATSTSFVYFPPLGSTGRGRIRHHAAGCRVSNFISTNEDSISCIGCRGHPFCLRILHCAVNVGIRACMAILGSYGFCTGKTTFQYGLVEYRLCVRCFHRVYYNFRRRDGIKVL